LKILSNIRESKKELKQTRENLAKFQHHFIYKNLLDEETNKAIYKTVMYLDKFLELAY